MYVEAPTSASCVEQLALPFVAFAQPGCYCMCSWAGVKVAITFSKVRAEHIKAG